MNEDGFCLDFVNTIILSPFLFTFVSGSEMLSPSLWASPGRYLAQPAWLMPGEPGPMAQGRPRDTVVTLRIVSPDIVTRPGYQARPWRPWEIRDLKSWWHYALTGLFEDRLNHPLWFTMMHWLVSVSHLVNIVWTWDCGIIKSLHNSLAGCFQALFSLLKHTESRQQPGSGRLLRALV